MEWVCYIVIVLFILSIAYAVYTWIYDKNTYIEPKPNQYYWDEIIKKYYK